MAPRKEEAENKARMKIDSTSSSGGNKHRQKRNSALEERRGVWAASEWQVQRKASCAKTCNDAKVFGNEILEHNNIFSTGSKNLQKKSKIICREREMQRKLCG